MSNGIQWKGRQAFYLSGTRRDDNTLRIAGVAPQSETRLRLELPTLCITYADMAFANDIGGYQKEWPDSAEYGPIYFDPPVEIFGEQDIERLTWIRGAHQVTIGPEVTVIEWWGYKSLVIPKLRIESKRAASALMDVPGVTVTMTQPFMAQIMQYVNGRHVGGVQVVKRHPDWQPEPTDEKYHLWVRAIDAEKRNAVPEALVTLYRWEGDRWSEKGEFTHEAKWHTDGMGIVDMPDLPCRGKQMVTIEAKEFEAVKWRFRPLDGQWVRRTFKLVHA